MGLVLLVEQNAFFCDVCILRSLIEAGGPNLAILGSGAPASLARPIKVSVPRGDRFSMARASRLSQSLELAKDLAYMFGVAQ